MITSARPLPICQIIKGNTKQKYKKTVWCRAGQEELITHKSWVSLKLIITWCQKILQKKPILYVPEYFCYGVLHQIEEDAELAFYPITEMLTVNMEQVIRMAREKKPDILLAVHYFGRIQGMNEIKVFCKKYDTILIEDAAHVLYPQKGVGISGDFTLYSPWKSCGFPDGAALIINEKGVKGKSSKEVRTELGEINRKFADYPKLAVWRWKIKKILQKVIPHELYQLCGYKRKTDYEKEEPFCVSSYSFGMMINHSDQNLRELGEKKKRNAKILYDYLSERYNVSPFTDYECDVPYALTVRLESGRAKERLKKDIGRIGRIIDDWPDLYPKLPKDSNAKKLKQDMLLIAVHDGITFRRVKRKLKIHGLDGDFNSLKGVCITEISKEEYEIYSDEYTGILPLVQSIQYSHAKSVAQGWKASFYKVSIDHKMAAFFLTLNKYGIIYRLNRGPVLFEKEKVRLVYGAIRNFFSKKLGVLYLAPNMEQTGANMIMLMESAYQWRGDYFSTGFIDLAVSEDGLRKNLDSKWRNQLKAAEKRDCDIRTVDDTLEFYRLLEMHKQDKKDRGYRDSGDEITEALFHSGVISILEAQNGQNETISFVMTVRHGKTATYLIGWTNEEGYKANMNRLLLWKAILMHKKEGCLWFDLGGIDFIHTPGIADFKMGTKCQFFVYAGEFWGI